MSFMYRVQDVDGRGPFKPGLSKFWIIERPDHENLLPWTAFVSRNELSRWHQRYRHLGCACRSIEELRRWFIPMEYETLLLMGYQAVKLLGCEVLWQDNTQCVIGRNKSFSSGAFPISLHAEELA